MSLWKALTRKKTASQWGEQPHLKKCLSVIDLTLMGVGAIIGTGIFILSGVAAATNAGPAVMVSFVIASIACGFAALSYAELAASVGGCGSAYGYSYAAFGEFIAWLIGWDLILEYAVSVAAVATGWSSYVVRACHGLGFPMPEVLTQGPSSGGIINLPAVLIVFVLMGMLILGIKESARLNASMVFIKLLAITIFLTVCFSHVNFDLWDPFMPFGWFHHTATGGTVGVLAGSALVFFAYVGFDAVSTAVEEARNPQRDVPLGIILSLGFCTLAYIVVSGVLTAVVSYTELNVASPISFALERIGANWAAGVVAAGIIAGLTTVMLVMYYGLTRILLSVAMDGLLPSLFSHVSPMTKTPIPATVFMGCIIACLAGLFPLGSLAELVNIGTLLAFVLVCMGVIMLRFTQPKMLRPFKAPLGILTPIMGVLSCSALIAFLPYTSFVRLGIWMFVGLIVYFTYSLHHSKLSR